MGIMEDAPRTACPECQRVRQQLAALQAQVELLTATVAQLQEQLARARKDSSTSSKPPSSDLVKPGKTPPADGSGKRPPGGQPGHPRHQRPLLPPELLNGGTHTHGLDLCPTCGHGLRDIGAAARRVQQIDIEGPPLRIEEHRALAGYCPHCQELHYAALPPAIEHGGLVGPRLTTLIAYLKGACHASYSTIRKFLRDVLQVTISRGQLAKVIGKVSQALDAPYQELLDRLPAEARLHVDETGHPDRGERWWTWCFRAGLYTLFKIDPTRSGDVLLEVLGEEFNGVLGCDYFSAYRRYLRECDVVIQFCLAHLIRDVKFLTTLPDPRERAYGERLREALRALFGVIHRQDELPDRTFRAQLRAARDAVLRVATADVPPTRHSQNMARRFEHHGQAYFEFVTTPGVEPTNNLAEQAIRFVVIDRHITQGTHGETGRRWCERIWTVMATCSQQGRSVFEYLSAAVAAAFQQTAVPSLLTEQS
jgi:transposase